MPIKSFIMNGSSSSSSSGGFSLERVAKKTMGRGRIEIKKIENVSNRQVTFSKRRAGLMKKAKELAILCDAEVGIIVFSGTGKLYEFASSRLQDIISRYERNSDRSENSVLEYTPQGKHPKVEALEAEIVKLQKVQRMMMGKELEGLSYKELEQLEQQLHDGLSSVKNHKERSLKEEIQRIKLREQKAVLENEALKKQIAGFLNNLTPKIRLLEIESPFASSKPVTYGTTDNRDVGISLRLGLSSGDDLHKRKIPKIECDP